MVGSDERALIAFESPAPTPSRNRLVPFGPQLTQTTSNPRLTLVWTISPDWPLLRKIACRRPPGSSISPRPCLPTLASSQPSNRCPAFDLSAVRYTMNRLPDG